MVDKKKKVVLIEDNPDDIELTKRAFKKNNISEYLVVFNDGIEALEYLFKEGKDSDSDNLPTLILLDLKLSKLNGLEILKKIRDNPETKFIPVVMLTTSDEEEDIISSYELGANSYIRKPVNFKQFNETINQLGLYWLLLNKPAPNNKRNK